MTEREAKTQNRRYDAILAFAFLVFVAIDAYAGLCGSFVVTQTKSTQFYQQEYADTCRPFDRVNGALFTLPQILTLIPTFTIINDDPKGDRQDLPPLAVKAVPVGMVVQAALLAGAFFIVRKTMHRRIHIA